MEGSGRPDVPTLESVAALAGVSRATASRVLNGSEQVSERSRTAVLDAASQLSYVPNAAARSLVRRRSDSIAFVVSETEERFFSDPFFAAVLRGVHTVVAARGLQLVFTVSSCDEDRDKLVRFAASGHVDGAILVSVHGEDPLPDRLRGHGVPVVLSGRPYAGPDEALFVDADNVGGARQAATVLVERGCRRIGTIAGPGDMVAAQDRLQGFREVLSEAGQADDSALRVRADFTVDGGRAAMDVLLQRTPDLDGVFAANDLMAVGAVQALVDRGLRIPDDVAVVGYDDVAVAAAANPPLTTVRQPMEHMGREMARLLLEVVDGGAADGPVVLPTSLVRRVSA